MSDPFQKFKAAQKEVWSLFAPVEVLTTPPAGKLVSFAGIKSGERVLDVGCGTGVVAVTAARRGAIVCGLDLAPVLLEKGRQNAAIAQVTVDYREGDAEALPYRDGEFDVVLSQFGHMFAPRPQVAIAEMLRVLKPGGRIAFSTWPPEHFTSLMFALVSRYLPPPPDAAPPPQWGNPEIVRERLGKSVRDLHFERDIMLSPYLSPGHFRHFMESVGPLVRLTAELKDKPELLQKFRTELDALILSYSDGNTVRQHFLMSRAVRL